MTVRLVTMALLSAFALAMAGLLSMPPSVAFSAPGDETTVTSLSLEATYESISVYASFSGDDNANNFASFEWRESGGTWKQGMDMTVDRRTTFVNPYVNQWRASVIGLQPNTAYDVEVTFSDPDSVSGTNPVTATITTRNDVIPLGTGNTYYVSPTGADTACVNGNTFQTIQQAANCVSAGDTVYIRAGTYLEQVTISSSGTASNWITFMNFGNDIVTIDGEGIRNNMVVNNNVQYIRIKGLRFINAVGRALTINNGAKNIVIEDCYFTGFGDNAIIVGTQYGSPSNVENVVIQRNEILRTTAKTSGTQGHLISFMSTNGGHIVRDNTIRDTSGWIRDQRYDGDYWDCIGGAPNGAIRRIVQRDSDIYNNYIEGCNDDGIEAEGGDVNVRIWGNTIKDTYQGIAYAVIYIGPLYVFRNVIDIAGTNKGNAFKLGKGSTGFGYFYHNTIYLTGTQDTGDGLGGFAQSDPYVSNLISRNNIIHAGRYVIEFAGTADVSTMDFDYDNLYTTDSLRFVKWEGSYGCCGTFNNFRSFTGQETNGMSIAATNEFVDAASGNFQLQSSSQFINTGTILIGFNDANSPWPYVGSAPDLGAFEYGTPDSTPAMPGDANGDGKVDSLDITKLERIILGLDASTPDADANQDGNIDALDITALQQIMMAS